MNAQAYLYTLAAFAYPLAALFFAARWFWRALRGRPTGDAPLILALLLLGYAGGFFVIHAHPSGDGEAAGMAARLLMGGGLAAPYALVGISVFLLVKKLFVSARPGTSGPASERASERVFGRASERAPERAKGGGQ